MPPSDQTLANQRPRQTSPPRRRLRYHATISSPRCALRHAPPRQSDRIHALSFYFTRVSLDAASYLLIINHRSKAWTVNPYNQTGKRSLHVLKEPVAKGIGCGGASLRLERQELFQKVPHARALHWSSDVLVSKAVPGSTLQYKIGQRIKRGVNCRRSSTSKQCARGIISRGSGTGWSGACFIRLNRRPKTDAEGEGQTQQSIKVLYMVLYMVHAQKPEVILMLYLRINTHIASLKEITGSAECHL